MLKPPFWATPIFIHLCHNISPPIPMEFDLWYTIYNAQTHQYATEQSTSMKFTWLNWMNKTFQNTRSQTKNN